MAFSVTDANDFTDHAKCVGVTLRLFFAVPQPA